MAQKICRNLIFFCSLLDTSRSGAHLCGGKGTCDGQSLHQGKNGSRYSGVKVKADEREPHKPEIQT